MTTEHEGHAALEHSTSGTPSPLEKAISLREELAEVEESMQADLRARIEFIDRFMRDDRFSFPEEDNSGVMHNSPELLYFRSTDENDAPLVIRVKRDTLDAKTNPDSHVYLTFDAFDDPTSSAETPTVPSAENKKLTLMVGYTRNTETNQFDPNKSFGMTVQTPEGSAGYRSAPPRITADNRDIPTPFAAMDRVLGYFQRVSQIRPQAQGPAA